MPSQPDSIPNNEAPVVPQLVKFLEARMRYGRRKYGVVLQPHNGRDAALDCFEEAVDLCVYFAQVLIERDGSLPEVKMPEWHEITEAGQIRILKESPAIAPPGWYLSELGRPAYRSPEDVALREPLPGMDRLK